MNMWPYGCDVIAYACGHVLCGFCDNLPGWWWSEYAWLCGSMKSMWKWACGTVRVFACFTERNDTSICIKLGCWHHIEWCLIEQCVAVENVDTVNPLDRPTRSCSAVQWFDLCDLLFVWHGTWLRCTCALRDHVSWAGSISWRLSVGSLVFPRCTARIDILERSSQSIIYSVAREQGQRMVLAQSYSTNSICSNFKYKQLASFCLATWYCKSRK